jgi:hypothetical protein
MPSTQSDSADGGDYNRREAITCPETPAKALTTAQLVQMALALLQSAARV